MSWLTVKCFEQYLRFKMIISLISIKLSFTTLPLLQGPGDEQFFEAPATAPLLFNKLWLRLQLQISSGNFIFQFDILIHNIYYKKERLIKQ